MRPHILFAAFLTFIAASAAVAHEGATGVVKERMEAMESMAKAVKAINQRLKQKRELETIKADAKTIHDGAAKMLSLFPGGSGGHPSEAKNEVWQKWPDFEAKARVLETESKKLAQMEPRDLRAIEAQFRRVSDACGNCHELYRTKQHRHGADWRAL
jgi:cytochrome c556